MKLILTVADSQQGGAPRGTSRTIQNETITVGRGAGCDWILPDPLNHLSKRHCAIAVSEQGVVVMDLSTNGVFINQAEECLGNGNSAALGDGDRLTLGDYVIEARIAAGGETHSNPIPENDDDPFGIGDLVSRPAPPPPSRDRPVHDEPFVSPFPPSSAGPPPVSSIPENIAWLDEESGAASPAPSQALPIDSPLARSDHLPAHESAYIPPRVEGTAIPEDWWNEEPVAAGAGRAERRAPAPGSGGGLMEAFLAGAGLPDDALRGQDEVAVMRAIGSAYRAAVLGIADILRTRAAIKYEFRIEATHIAGIGNNPLKMLDKPDEILAAMIGVPPRGFQEAGIALRDGIRDLKVHQLATVAAIQVALTQLLAQLDPGALKSRLDRRSILANVLPAARKARYWEVFEESYKAIAAELEEDFNGVFGKAFAEAYENGMTRL